MTVVGESSNGREAVELNIALTALVIGSALLLLSAFWHQARAAIVKPLPESLRESDRLPEPLFTPATKAQSGHDINITYEQTLADHLAVIFHALFPASEHLDTVFVDAVHERLKTWPASAARRARYGFRLLDTSRSDRGHHDRLRAGGSGTQT